MNVLEGQDFFSGTCCIFIMNANFTIPRQRGFNKAPIIHRSMTFFTASSTASYQKHRNRPTTDNNWCR